MEELNRASEHLTKEAEKDVKIVYRPPATLAVIRCEYDPSGEDWNARTKAEAIAKKFVEDTNLFSLKPDMRIFGCTDGDFAHGSWTLCITVPDDFEIPSPFVKKFYDGGLFAMHPANWDFDFGKWAEESDKYEWGNQYCGKAEEYINPFNVYGLKNIDSEITGAMYTELLFPIKELHQLTDEQKEMIAKLDEAALRGKPVEIDLRSSMEKQGDFELDYADGFMEITNGAMATKQNFNLPLRIELRAKTDRLNLNVGYDKGGITFNFDYVPSTLLYMNSATGEWITHKKSGKIPANEFVDIEYILGKEITVVRVNGELRHVGDQYQYIEKMKENPEFVMSAPVSIRTFKERATGIKSAVTVESLRVTEL